MSVKELPLKQISENQQDDEMTSNYLTSEPEKIEILEVKKSVSVDKTDKRTAENILKDIEKAQSDMDEREPVPPTKLIDEEAMLSINLTRDIVFPKPPSRVRMSPSLNIRGT